MLGPSSDSLPSFLSPQGGGSGEEQLCADFPELDLSQLDASDFDSATCFGELQWCPESSETEPSQYSPDDSELFQVRSPSLAVTPSTPEGLALPCTTFFCTCSCKEVSSPTKALGTLPLVLDLPLILGSSHPLAEPVITSGQ